MSARNEDGTLEIDPEQVVALLGGQPPAQLIDVRQPYEHEAGHIAEGRHIELTELAGAADSVQRDRAVVFYCRVGNRSLMAAQAFRGAGYEAYSMSGGLARWSEEGRPLEPADGYVADH